MTRFSTELKVGAFALLTLSILTLMTFKVGGFEWLASKEGYIVYVQFKNIAGLDKKTKVKIAGVDAGTIERIELVEGRARLTVRVKKNITIYSDAQAAVKATGMLGDKYLDIKIGSSRPVLQSGDSIKNVAEIVDLDDLAHNVSDVSININKLMDSLNEALGTDEAKQSLRETVLNLREITSNLNTTITLNDKKLRNVLDNINNLVASIDSLVKTNQEPINTTLANLKDFSGTLKADAPSLVSNLNKATRELKDMIEESRSSVKEASGSLASITKKIDSGEGTIGKLVKDDRLYESLNKAAEGVNKTISAVERFRTFITFQTDYLTKPKDGKGYFYVTLQPRSDKYYILGVVGDSVGKVETKETTTNGVLVKEEKVEKQIEFTAQFAKRFSTDTALRIGLTENTFGAGVDQFFNNDKVKLSADIWDVSSDEQDSKRPHVKVGADYFVFKNVFVSGGVDNIMNKKHRGGYVGAGLKFEDEDFKYLFGTIPKIPSK